MQPLETRGAGGSPAPMTAAEKAKVEARLNKMKGSLKDWLKFRKRMDDAAMGKRKAKVPASVLAKTLPLKRDWKLEQRLAVQMHALLSELMDASQLPNPDVTKDPNAAVKLAEIVVAGTPYGIPQGPQAQGIFPLLVLGGIGAVALIFMQKISSDADVAKEKERIECIKAGACTDSGFWTKMAAVAVLGLIAKRSLEAQDMAFWEKKGGR
jgi:hypothetical protein